MRGAPSFFKLFASSRGRRAAMPPFRARANQGDACGQVSARDGSPPRRPDRRSRKVYRQVLSRDPAHANAAFLLGAIALGSGRTDAAVEALRRAIELEPTNAYHANLGEAYRRLGSYSQAIASFETAISIKPDFAEPAFNLGLLMEKAGELEVALACFERAAQSKPDSAAIARQLEVARAKHTASSRERNGDSGGGHDLAIQAWLALAAGRRLLGRFDEAVALCRRALAYDPRRVATLLRLAEVLAEAGLTDEAVDRLGLAREIEPGHLEALARQLAVLQSSGRLEEAVALLRRCLEIKDAPSLRSLLVLTLPYLPGYDDAAILEEARAWERAFAAPIASETRPFAVDRSPDRRLRVGYISPSFLEHAHCFFLEPLFANHDRQSFEFFLYFDVVEPDAQTERFRKFADTWRDTAALPDDALADLVRRDRIDVLVDLTMHTRRGRLLVFARRPAPVQICWLAYPGTTGLSAIDYRITDPYLDPPDVDPSVYAERSLVLADSFWCYSPRTSTPHVSPLPALAEGRITFGCLNNFCKVNAGGLELWASVMREVAESRLVLLAPPGDPRRRVLEVLGKQGIESGRVAFADRLSRHQYLARYQGIDVSLDPFPCPGHTTSMDSFWMGVPVVTLAGKTVIGRAGVSISMNLGLPELIATTAQEYVRIAVDLCRDLPRLRALRAGLRERMEASPLMDGSRFAKSMERQYGRAWRDWCQGPSADAVLR